MPEQTYVVHVTAKADEFNTVEELCEYIRQMDKDYVLEVRPLSEVHSC